MLPPHSVDSSRTLYLLLLAAREYTYTCFTRTSTLVLLLLLLPPYSAAITITSVPIHNSRFYSSDYYEERKIRQYKIVDKW